MLNPTMIIVAGAAPLLIATCVSFFSEPSRGPGPPLGSLPKPLDLSKVLTRSREQQDQIENQARPLVQQLQKFDPFASETKTLPAGHPAPAVTGEHARDWLAGVQKNWEAARTVHSSIVHVVETGVGGSSSGDRQEELGERLESLAQLSSDATANPLTNAAVDGGRQFVSHIDQLRERLSVQLANEKHLAAALARLDQEDYDGCLSELGQIDRSVLSSDAEQLGEADETQRQAEFWKHWSAEPPATDVSEKSMESRYTLRQTSPPAELPEEKEKLARVDAQLVRLNCEKAITRLRNDPPTDVRGFLQRATPVVETCPDNRETIRTLFEQWLEKQLPRRPVPANGQIKEAVRKDGTLIAGVYEKAPGNILWYKYWPTQASRQQKGSDNYDDSLFVPQQIKQAPREPVIVKSIRELNELRDELIDDFASKQAWENFLEFCKAQKVQISEYSRDGGLTEFERAAGKKVPSPDFDKPVELAGEVLAEWSQVSSLLSR